jgi:2-dehydro-3-deoxyphosphooctonate aldolase (KDO 8-P synthase)
MDPHKTIDLGRLRIGAGYPLVVIAGPCVIESESHALMLAREIQVRCQEAGLPFIFKASFDKANRSSHDSFRGHGLEFGLSVLQRVREECGVPVTTDVHLPEQVDQVADVVDLIQIPAFLCRQTDLLQACAETGRPINIKKGQFMAPAAMAGVLGKLEGAQGVMLTERGTTFGHGDLVVDMRGLVQMRRFGVPLCFDATHSCQKPAGGPTTAGDRSMAAPLARAAVATGVDAVFAEVHERPENAPSDGANMLRLEHFSDFLAPLTDLDRLGRGTSA